MLTTFAYRCVVCGRDREPSGLVIDGWRCAGGCNMAENKSALDGAKVVNKAFPSDPDYCEGEALVMTVVGECKFCGSPIYGYKAIKANDPVEVKHTCTCRFCPPAAPKPPLNTTKEEGMDISQK